MRLWQSIPTKYGVQNAELCPKFIQIIQTGTLNCNRVFILKNTLTDTSVEIDGMALLFLSNQRFIVCFESSKGSGWNWLGIAVYDVNSFSLLSKLDPHPELNETWCDYHVTCLEHVSDHSCVLKSEIIVHGPYIDDERMFKDVDIDVDKL
eukprot:gnl/Dysnectes_brevis/4975_a6949_737.p1 GENE.gnl/Dysnectes_brevis/4975_a6949_737~~gnl/Dysnectes_brevis/4975_a6949_737.p1  ORF type:complete len:150 (-),score=2.77 gnl/Dysnectes_brevis/4975_a6949_737:216-665(-)